MGPGSKCFDSWMLLLERPPLKFSIGSNNKGSYMYCLNVMYHQGTSQHFLWRKWQGKEGRFDASPHSHAEATGTISDHISLARANPMTTFIFSGTVEATLQGHKKLRTWLFIDHPAVEHQEVGISAASHYIPTPSIDPRLLELGHKSSSSGVWHRGSF